MFARRPWGWWLVLLDHKHFKLKLLRVRPSKSLSLQRHWKRSELWLFLSGSGFMKIGRVAREESMNIISSSDQCVRAGQWRDIPFGHWHKYEATTSTWVLEVQYGDECKETDIVRVP